jgi:hypothetical protein
MTAFEHCIDRAVLGGDPRVALFAAIGRARGERALWIMPAINAEIIV